MEGRVWRSRRRGETSSLARENEDVSFCDATTYYCASSASTRLYNTYCLYTMKVVSQWYRPQKPSRVSELDMTAVYSYRSVPAPLDIARVDRMEQRHWLATASGVQVRRHSGGCRPVLRGRTPVL